VLYDLVSSERSEENMSAEESTSRSGASHSGAAVPYDYGYVMSR